MQCPREGIIVDPKNIEAVRDWVRPISVTQFQSFMGLARYYHRFVEGLSSIASPLTRLTRRRCLSNYLESVMLVCNVQHFINYC